MISSPEAKAAYNAGMSHNLANCIRSLGRRCIAAFQKAVRLGFIVPVITPCCVFCDDHQI